MNRVSLPETRFLAVNITLWFLSQKPGFSCYCDRSFK